MEKQDTGILLNPNNIKLHRNYFKEMCRLIGINVLHRSPKEDIKYDSYGELDAKYNLPEKVGCIFEEHPNQWTMKKLGWNSETSESVSLISVPYDLQGLQAGSLFIIPSGLDNAQGRVFKVLRMSTISIYPASITCEIGPMFESTFNTNDLHDFSKTGFNLLNEEED